MLSACDASLGNCRPFDQGVWTKGRYVATRHRVRQTAGDYRTGALGCQTEARIGHVPKT